MERGRQESQGVPFSRLGAAPENAGYKAPPAPRRPATCAYCPAQEQARHAGGAEGRAQRHHEENVWELLRRVEEEGPPSRRVKFIMLGPKL